MSEVKKDRSRSRSPVWKNPTDSIENDTINTREIDVNNSLTSNTEFTEFENVADEIDDNPGINNVCDYMDMEYNEQENNATSENVVEKTNDNVSAVMKAFDTEDEESKKREVPDTKVKNDACKNIAISSHESMNIKVENKSKSDIINQSSEDPTKSQSTNQEDEDNKIIHTEKLIDDNLNEIEKNIEGNSDREHNSKHASAAHMTVDSNIEAKGAIIDNLCKIKKNYVNELSDIDHDEHTSPVCTSEITQREELHENECRNLAVKGLPLHWLFVQIKNFVAGLIPNFLNEDVYVTQLMNAKKEPMGTIIMQFFDRKIFLKSLLTLKQTKYKNKLLKVTPLKDADLPLQIKRKKKRKPLALPSNIKMLIDPLNSIGDVGTSSAAVDPIVAPVEKKKYEYIRLFKAPPDSAFSDDLYGLSVNFLQKLGIKPPLRNILHVTNLPIPTEKEKLHEVFSLAGDVKKITTIHRKGFTHAWIEYDHSIEAVQAISMFKGQTLYERPIGINMSTISNPDRIPRGLSGIGPGLGDNSQPLKCISTVMMFRELKKKINELCAQIEELKEVNVEQFAKPPEADNSLNMQNNMLLGLGAIQTLMNSGANNNFANLISTLMKTNANNPQNQGNIPNFVQNTAGNQNTQNSWSGFSLNSPINQDPQNTSFGFRQSTSSMANNENSTPGFGLNQLRSNVPPHSFGPPISSNMPQNQRPPNPNVNHNAPHFAPNQPLFAQNQPTLMPNNPRGPLTPQGYNQNTQNYQNNTNNRNAQQYQPNFNSDSPYGQQNKQMAGSSQGARDKGIVMYDSQEPETRPQFPSNSQDTRNFGNRDKTSDNSNNKNDMLLFDNLPPSVTVEALNNKMREVGDLMFGELTGRGRAIVRFSNFQDAERCIKLFNRSKVDGQIIQVSYF